MKVIFVSMKSQLTSWKEQLEQYSYDVYRVRTTCNCPTPSNRRDGILVILNNEVRYKVIRCKACAGKEAHNG